MAKTTELVTNKAELTTWERASGTAVDSRKYSGGETLVEKTALEGKELVVVGAKLNTSDSIRRRDPETNLVQANEFVSLTCILREPIIVDGETVNVIVFNDGGVGIRQIVADHIRAHFSEDTVLDWHSYRFIALDPAIYCRRGLRPSRYTYTDGNGSEAAATTWYLA